MAETTDGNVITVPLSPLRQIIARRMVETNNEIPHFRVTLGLHADALIAWRAAYNREHADQRVSLNDCLIKACALALAKTPDMNIQFVDEVIHQYEEADIAVVMAVEGGLVTPIVRNAGAKDLATIASETTDFAARGKTGRLKISEMTGGTLSISNLGMFNVDQFDAIINPPQCAIVAFGAAKPTPIIKDGAVTVATIINATVSVDHRTLDGVVGAKFLNALQEVVSAPELLA
ncbi:MAG: 2-oxo acid dehydrogenase subunit E2 [Pseudomonadota bacterium]